MHFQDMLTEIENEIEEHDDEHESYGMFVLMFMSHGAENGVIYGTDGKGIQLKQVYRSLTPTSFPAMKGKPKFVIVQACGGCEFVVLLCMKNTDVLLSSCYALHCYNDVL